MEKTIRAFGRSELAQQYFLRAQRARPTVLPPDLAHVSMAQVPGVACP